MQRSGQAAEVEAKVEEEKVALLFLAEALRGRLVKYLKLDAPGYDAADEAGAGPSNTALEDKAPESPAALLSEKRLTEHLVDLCENIKAYKKACAKHKPEKYKANFLHPHIETIGFRSKDQTAASLFEGRFADRHSWFNPAGDDPHDKAVKRYLSFWDTYRRSIRNDVQQVEGEMINLLRRMDEIADALVPPGPEYNLARQLLFDKAASKGEMLKKGLADDCSKGLAFVCKLATDEIKTHILDNVKLPIIQENSVTERADTVSTHFIDLIKCKNITFYDALQIMDYLATKQGLTLPERAAFYYKRKTQNNLRWIDGSNTTNKKNWTSLQKFMQSNDDIMSSLADEIGGFLTAWPDRGRAMRGQVDAAHASRPQRKIASISRRSSIQQQMPGATISSSKVRSVARVAVIGSSSSRPSDMAGSRAAKPDTARHFRKRNLEHLQEGNETIIGDFAQLRRGQQLNLPEVRTGEISPPPRKIARIAAGKRISRKDATVR